MADRKGCDGDEEEDSARQDTEGILCLLPLDGRAQPVGDGVDMLGSVVLATLLPLRSH